MSQLSDSDGRLKLGYKASAEQFDPRSSWSSVCLRRPVVWTPRSVAISTLSAMSAGMPPFALSWVTAVAERTERIRLGSSVFSPTFRYNPTVLAQALVTMACLHPTGSAWAWVQARP